MTYIKKILVIFFIAMFSVTTITNVAMAQSNILYQTSSQQTITAGATLEHISRFTVDGWLNIKVLRLDTSNPNIKIDTLANNHTMDKLSTVLSLAEENDAVAAVNASFFNGMDEGVGYHDGPIVRSGEILSTSSWYNQNKDAMASFSLDNNGQPFFSYWKNSLTLKGLNNKRIAVSQYNQPSRQQYNDITVLDTKWGPSTLGASEEYPDLTEILVSQGRVIEIRQGLPPVTMPLNGYVIISKGEQASKLIESFKVGYPVVFTITSNPDWSSLRMSVTGSSILVKDGKIPETFSYSTGSFNNKHPRTLIGNSQSGNELILVTVDGRQDNSIGLTQYEAAELMQELGAYNALIFDGGGSTTMVARQQGMTSLEVVNIPSEGSLRSVANGIGVFSQAAPGPLTELILETEDPNVFVHTSRKYTLRGLDRNANPVEINPYQIQWSASGIEGNFDSNVFRPTSVGSGKIIAKVGELTAELDIRSLDSPVKLAINSKYFKVPKGQSQTLQVEGYDQQGFTAKMQPEDVQWTVNGEIGDYKDGVFEATTVGTGYIEAVVGDIQAYSGVSVYSDFSKILYSFEPDQANQGLFHANPQVAQGSFQISTEQVHSGNNAGQLIYDYFDSKSLGEASLAFQGKGIPLDKDTSRLAIWINNTHKNANRIKGEVLDASGKKHQIEFTAELDWIGWKQLESSLEKINAPEYLTRIYIQNVDSAVGWGKVFLDDLSATVSKYPEIDQSTIPLDTIPQDEANRPQTFFPGPDSFKFSVFADGDLDMGVSAGTEYKTYDYKNSTFIELDISKGGLRRSDPQQWTRFFKDLEDMKGSNTFIIMSSAPASFINAKEGKLLEDTLAEYREKTGNNIWVFYQGAENQSQLDRGVRYISCADPSSSAENSESTGSLQVTVQGDDVTFEFKL